MPLQSKTVFYAASLRDHEMCRAVTTSGRKQNARCPTHPVFWASVGTKEEQCNAAFFFFFNCCLATILEHNLPEILGLLFLVLVKSYM